MNNEPEVWQAVEEGVTIIADVSSDNAWIKSRDSRTVSQWR